MPLFMLYSKRFETFKRTHTERHSRDAITYLWAYFEWFVFYKSMDTHFPFAILICTDFSISFSSLMYKRGILFHISAIFITYLLESVSIHKKNKRIEKDSNTRKMNNIDIDHWQYAIWHITYLFTRSGMTNQQTNMHDDKRTTQSIFDIRFFWKFVTQHP